MTPALREVPEAPGGTEAVTSTVAGFLGARDDDGPSRAPAHAPRQTRRILPAVILTLLALALITWLSLAIGAQRTSAAEVWRVLMSRDSADPAYVSVVSLRVPRTLLGLAAGAALGAAGAIMQGLTRNPLADPGMLGVNAGASLAVVLAIAVLGTSSPGALVWFAMLGALVALVIVLAISIVQRDGATPATVPIVGMSLTALCTAGVSIVLLSDRGALTSFRHWQVGSLAGRDLDALTQAAPVLVVGGLAAVLAGPALNLLALGDDLARGLGARLGLARALCLGAIVLLCGGAVSVVGPIAFIGLVVPHLVRGVTGPDQRLVIAGSALTGPIVLLVADVAGRVIVPPGELEAGLVVAFLGAPALILYARRLGAPRTPRNRGRRSRRLGVLRA